MRVNVLFFGLLKEMVGRSSDQLELEEGARVETVFGHYASQFPKLEEMADSVAMARNQEFASPDAPLSDGDEIALMPPVSGGSDAGDDLWMGSVGDERGFYAITQRPIDSAALAREHIADADGAVITFEGVVRDNTRGRGTLYLDYECYAPLALKTMRRLGERILDDFDVRAVVMVHRVGRLQIREASVAILVFAAHRRAAYEASREAINRLKKVVPVWKKEYFEDGEVWVEGAWDDQVLRPSGVSKS